MKGPIKIPNNPWNQLPADEMKVGADKLPNPAVKMENSQWNEISGLQPPQVIRKFDGVNELGFFAIQDSHATKSKNMTTSKYPALAVRTAGTKVTGTGLPATEIDGIGIRGTEINVITNGVWYALRGSTWTSLKTGLNTSKKYSFINFQGAFSVNNLLAANGTDAVLKYDGTTVATLLNPPSGVVGNFITTHDNRVYMASGSTVYFSALRKAEDWATVNDSGQIVVETTDGKSITGLIAGSSRLTVFKQNTIHELFGNNPGNYKMQIVTENLGSPTGNSAQVIDGVIYFLGNDGVYRYSGGSLPSNDFSLQVKETIKQINKAAADQSISWQIGRKYYLAIPTGSNTNPDTVLEFDIDFNTWNVWSFPSPITCKGAIMDGYTYIGCADGTIYKMDGLSTQDNGIDISYQWISKPFTLDTMAAKSRWYRIWIVADIPTGATFNLSVSTDGRGSTWTSVTSITANTNIQAKEILIPTNLVTNANWVQIKLEGSGQVVVYEVSRQQRSFPIGLN
jgi:hypothetical protein